MPLPFETDAQTGFRVFLETSGTELHGEKTVVLRALARLGLPPAEYTLYRTPWGQPRLRRKPGITKSRRPVPLISMSHDGGVSLLAMISDERVVGIGVDIVAANRLAPAGSDDSRWKRFLSRIAGPEERMLLENDQTTPQEMAMLAARCFALKEAASKALGTGLKLGLGLGAGWGVPPKALRVCGVGSEPCLAAVGAAAQRLRRIGGCGFAATVVGQDQHTVAVVVALAAGARNQLALPIVIGM